MRVFARNQSRQLRALSLIEVLITLALLSLVMGLVSALASQYLRLAGDSSRRSRGSLALQALESMAEEISGACEISVPLASGAVAEEVVFLKPDPSLARFPLPAPAIFQPGDPARCLQVRYFLDNGRLLRRFTATAPPLLVQSEMAGFSARRRNKQDLELSLTLEEGQGLTTVRTRIYCWWEK